MSAAAGVLRRLPGEAAGEDRREVAPVLLQLAAFGGLAAFATAHWGTLIAEPPGGRLAACVAVALAAAGLLAVLGRSSLGAPVRAALAAAVGLVTVAAGLVIAGLPARYLLPGNRHELADNLDRGLGGIRTVDWPYAGDEEWLRLSLLLAVPLVLGVAATLAFWPARRGHAGLRALALVLLLLLYGIAVTETQASVPLLRGLVLLALVAAWLWLPRLAASDAVPAAAVVLAVGVVSLPLAARFDAQQPWWDYQSWNWFGNKVVSFNWEHSYGPLDWPRDGTTLLNVKSDRPHYWKVQVLDTFEGFRWVRSEGVDTGPTTTSEIPDPLNPRWDERIRVSVRALRSDFVIGAGTTYLVNGLDGTLTAADGTTRSLAEAVERGDSYEVFAYAPDPSARQMLAAPPDTAFELTEYTTLYLPDRGDSALEEQGGAPGPIGRERVVMPLRDAPAAGSPTAADDVEASPYARMFRLTERLTADAPTTYEAVKSVERYLQRSYAYRERVPSQEVPLSAFLFEDRAGYCQQFSGAMALMLRMAGIPARVATGFSPGSPNRDTGEFRVRDLDAHSWVEVHFAGIGWVPFDPTPSAAPPELQSSGALATSAARGDAGDALRGRGADISAEPTGGGGIGEQGGDVPGWVVPLVLAGAALLAGLVALGRGAHRRVALRPEDVVDLQVRELQHALPRLGWKLPGGTTLMALERRLARAAGPGAAAYVARLRERRFAPGRRRGPVLRDRRALRRELTAGRNPLRRLRGYMALPPLGPRTRDS